VKRPLPAAPIPSLARIDLVVVDVETTGWLPEEAAITEIGAVRLSAGHPAGEFSSLVNPGRAIPPEIARLTGITDALVSQAPPIDAVLPWFLAFASGCVLAAHNAPFDVGFLSAACRPCGVDWPAFAVIDTAVLARLVVGSEAGAASVPDCKLATLAEYFAAKTRPCHRALADARATADVLAGLLGLLAAPRPHALAGSVPGRLSA
jgi:DNA polymerase-3 subunit epsilon